jgi:hypothetical protein
MTKQVQHIGQEAAALALRHLQSAEKLGLDNVDGQHALALAKEARQLADKLLPNRVQHDHLGRSTPDGQEPQ